MYSKDRAEILISLLYTNLLGFVLTFKIYCKDWLFLVYGSFVVDGAVLQLVQGADAEGVQ